MRAIHRERPGFLNDGSTVWRFADHIERMEEAKSGNMQWRGFAYSAATRWPTGSTGMTANSQESSSISCRG